MLEVPKGLTIATTEKPRIVNVRMRIASIAILTSYDSIFLPRYSGVRPTINPAMKTANMTNTTMPYRPAPTPPKTTSPNMMLISGTIPPRGVNESCWLFTAPQLSSVVTLPKKAEFAIPNRTSFPSILPPECNALAFWFTAASKGFPRASAQYAVATPTKNRNTIAAHTAQPGRCEPVIRASLYGRAQGIAEHKTSRKKLEQGADLSKGWALLAPKNPP